eukprot:TRINITY_DN3895_c0_g1_i1.p1 TRINITY_DN3895_c0_g1~~TRINITY_DN3895_c0_g1_i1.p1  ORF type:complete len:685 (+),score=180.04 TRINITY_DN3895_c0_g1_i1:152-2206(+)
MAAPLSHRLSKGRLQVRSSATSLSDQEGGSSPSQSSAFTGNGVVITKNSVEWRRHETLLGELHGNLQSLSHKVTQLANALKRRPEYSPPPRGDDAELANLQAAVQGARQTAMQAITAAQQAQQETAALRAENMAMKAVPQAAAQAAMQTATQALAAAQQAQQETASLRAEDQAIKAELQAFRDMATGLRNDFRSVHDLKSGLQEVGQLRQEVGTLRPLKQELMTLQQTQQQHSQEVSGLRRSHDQHRQEVTGLKQSQEQHRQEVTGLKQSQEQQRQEVTGLKQSHEQHRQEVTSVRHSHEQHGQELRSLRQHAESGPATHMQVHHVSSELHALKQQLFDSGLLVPKLPPVDKAEEEKVVGTLELDEDVFTARLLVRLGLQKVARMKSIDLDDGLAALTLESDWDSEDSSSTMDEMKDNVAGIVVPDIDGDPGSLYVVTKGWALVCYITFLLQFGIVYIMFRNGKDEGMGCVDHEQSPFSWWVLHASKFLAILTAGVLMGKDIMDAVNYWMVSQLLEPRMNFEVLFCFTLRILLALFLGWANVIVYNALSSPALVWINMSALSFINQMGEAVLAIAKRGVFGHSICKTMTSLNYQLTFRSVYPRWFHTVHTLTMFGCIAFSVVCAAVVFFYPLPLCEGAADEFLGNGTLVLHGHGGHGAHAGHAVHSGGAHVAHAVAHAVAHGHR